MKRWLMTVLLVGASAVGCERDKVAVACVGTGTDVRCTITHTAGSHRLAPCWDYAGRCQNGTHVVAHACSNVAPGGTVTTFIPASQIHSDGTCDEIASLAVENLDVQVSK